MATLPRAPSSELLALNEHYQKRISELEEHIDKMEKDHHEDKKTVLNILLHSHNTIVSAMKVLQQLTLDIRESYKVNRLFYDEEKEHIRKKHRITTPVKHESEDCTCYYIAPELRATQRCPFCAKKYGLPEVDDV